MCWNFCVPRRQWGIHHFSSRLFLGIVFSFFIAVKLKLAALSFYVFLKIWGKVVFFTFAFGVFRLPKQILMDL